MTGTTLYVSMTNNEANPTAAGQLLSDLSFVLSGGLNTGTLSNKISSTVGSSNPITVLDSSFNATSTTSTPAKWQLSFGNSECVAGATSCYFLNDLTGGKPADMIIGPGPYTNANPSITGHSPSLAGAVVFEIDNIIGLTSNTTVSNVNLSFGTGPDGAFTLENDGSGTNQGDPAPEPAVTFLAGAGLAALALVRKPRQVRI